MFDYLLFYDDHCRYLHICLIGKKIIVCLRLYLLIKKTNILIHFILLLIYLKLTKVKLMYSLIVILKNKLTKM